jgi:hypothetical protein
MFDEIMGKFAGSPSQQAVIRLLLERGFSVTEEGRVVSGGIEIPIFLNISSIPSLMDLAPVLDLQVITIEVAAAGAPGIIAAVTALVAEAELSIRQIVSDDPEFSDDPRLYIITDAPVPGSLLRALVDLEFTRSVSVT